jgi:SAM-dependent methyltransferase
MAYGQKFFETYLAGRSHVRIVELGGMNINGSLRAAAPAQSHYVSVDCEDGPGVDLVALDPHVIPLESEWADACISSSCFEHAEFFWLTFLEALRILKPGGLLYLNVPSNGRVHRYPVDCWRFYPDAGKALQNWARHNGTEALLLESFVGKQGLSGWNDFVCVILKDQSLAEQYPGRILDNQNRAVNTYRSDRADSVSQLQTITEDQKGARHALRRVVLTVSEWRTNQNQLKP